MDCCHVRNVARLVLRQSSAAVAVLNPLSRGVACCHQPRGAPIAGRCNRCFLGFYCRRRGSHQSLSASPSIFMENTPMAIARPGNTAR